MTFYPTPAIRFPACPRCGWWLTVWPYSHAACDECDWLLESFHPNIEEANP